MTVLRPTPIVTTTHLTWDRPTRRFTAEASDLGPALGRGGFGRVYDDACDIGFTMVSARTGAEAVFAVQHEEIVDGDLLYWDLASVTGRDMKVRIFND